MVVELKQKSQITIPNDVMKKLKLTVGDKLDVSVEDGKIIIIPVGVIPEDQMWFYHKDWQDGERLVDEQIAHGKTYRASSKAELLEGLGLGDAD